MLDKKELLAASKEVLSKKGYTIVDGERLEWADYFVEKDGTQYSVSIVYKKDNNVKDKDARLKWISHLMYKNKSIIVTEDPIEDAIREHYPDIQFSSINE